jgi:hypothetical protein
MLSRDKAAPCTVSVVKRLEPAHQSVTTLLGKSAALDQHVQHGSSMLFALIVSEWLGIQMGFALGLLKVYGYEWNGS